MKKSIQGFVTGILITSILILCFSSYAESWLQTIEVVFNKVNLIVNGKKIDVPNILYNGTTYVPLRAVADALGKDVGWDKNSNTASINDKVVFTPIPIPISTSKPTPTNTPILNLIPTPLSVPEKELNVYIPKETNKRGNTLGNITNKATVSIQDGWIYYFNPKDHYSLYRINNYDLQKIKISNVNAFHEISVQGQWIYFIGVEDMDNGKIYKMLLNGSNSILVSDDRADYINVIGDWIYYRNVDNQNKLYKIKTDGTNRTKLTDEYVIWVNVLGDWIYYVNKGINKIKIDGGNIYKITNECVIDSMIVVDDWVYLINRTIKDSKTITVLYKIKTDSSNLVKICDINTMNMNILNGWIYYDNKDDYGKIYKMKLDGTEKIKLNNDSSAGINIVGDWVYYNNLDYNYKYYRMKIDGTENQLVE